MLDVHSAAKRELGLILVADLLLDPFGDGLTEEELKTAALEAGMSAPVFSEVIFEFWQDHAASHTASTVRASSTDLMVLSVSGDGHCYPPPFPMKVVPKLQDVFARLESRHGVRTPKSFGQIVDEMSDDPGDIRRALAFLSTFNHLKKSGDGFVRQRSIGGSMGEVDPNHPSTERLKAFLAKVGQIKAQRGDRNGPTVPPLEAFHLFLKKQGWSGLAGWWLEAMQEARGLWEHYPTAATVIAGALLECALVSIAEPSKNAGEWKHKFLSDDPRTWQLGALIKQAEAAGTFTAAEAAHAQTLAELRNRIHAGRFATSGPDPFQPPRTNRHEAQVSKVHLELLVGRLLYWRPVAALL